MTSKILELITSTYICVFSRFVVIQDEHGMVEEEEEEDDEDEYDENELVVEQDDEC